MSNEGTKKKGSSAARGAAISNVYVALMRDRWNLRRAAQHAGNVKLKRTLRRLAFRRASDSQAIADASDLDVGDPSVTRGVESFARDIGRANEIGTVAASLRSNRKLRIAIERALATNPPERVANRLSKLRDSASSEAGILEARLRDIAVHGFSGEPPVVE